ncbi:hypothetical protein B2D07_01105 [Desulfococcus multivorans]|nr:uncharacterized protein Dmul_02210 [Desulfococcus multivorans]AQU99514.1 hypothetical protein B2D07_01105 [Desulfococcus multivorans]
MHTSRKGVRCPQAPPNARRSAAVALSVTEIRFGGIMIVLSFDFKHLDAWENKRFTQTIIVLRNLQIFNFRLS